MTSVSDDKRETEVPTPRTDAEVRRLNYQHGGRSYEWERGMADHARQLERELFEATQEANRAHIGWTVRENEIARLKRELASMQMQMLHWRKQALEGAVHSSAVGPHAEIAATILDDRGFPAAAANLRTEAHSSSVRDAEPVDLMKALKDKLPQGVPVAWRYRYGKNGMWKYADTAAEVNPGEQYEVQPLYAASATKPNKSGDQHG